MFLPRVDVTMMMGIPVTTPTRTIIDLAAVAEESLVEEALDDLLRRNLVTRDRVGRRLADLSPRPGAKLIRRLLAARDPREAVPRSVLETKFLRVLKNGGLPKAVLQYPVPFVSGGKAFIDFAYPDLMVAIETDGRASHSGRQKEDDDRARHNELTAHGWRVMHVTWDDLIYRPEETLRRIRSALAQAASMVGRGHQRGSSA